jgi:C4-dicarboxylate-specific signal transduction histidine kinase
MVGLGTVGGKVESFETIGEDVAGLVLEAIAGKVTPHKLVSSMARPVVDWRQMMRWGFDRSLLPEGSQILNYHASVWEEYRAEIVAIVAVIALQSATIAALIVQYRRRRRITDELALERLELAHLSRVNQLGELSGAFAHELNQPLTSILANAEAGSRLLLADSDDRQELKAILDDIIADDKRASAIIGQLRNLMIKGEAKLDTMDLNSAVEATIALANSELLARQTKVHLDLEQGEIRVRGNLAQLQQLMLNLLFNAADAMSHLSTADRRVDIETRKRDDGSCVVAVTDRGPGLAPELRANVFRPFVSTKEQGLGLGLAICRSIALAHGGTLAFDDGRSGGARVVLTLPAL